jgi:L-aminopeptidase/D-esterase-like protein
MSSSPGLPEPTRELTLDGITLGHGTDLDRMTGVTVILCPEGATAAADVRGTATSTRQFDSLLKGETLGTQIHALVLAGGSAFGLSAADPVVRHLARGGYGLPTGLRPIPVVPTAAVFDLALGDPTAEPTPELVEDAIANAASGAVACGSVGVGTGASVGKVAGFPRAMKGGFGFASLHVPGGPTVAAAVAVNAYGDVRDPRTGLPVAGCRTAADTLELAGADRVVGALPPGEPHPWERVGNTTLAVVLTDAHLTKTQARKVCEMGFGGLHRAITPVLTLYDGDLIVTVSRGDVAAHVHQIGVLAEWAVAQAILTAVREADGFGLLPAVRDLAS